MTSHSKFYSFLFSLVLFVLPHNGSATTQVVLAVNSNGEYVRSHGTYTLEDHPFNSITGCLVTSREIEEAESSLITSSVIQELELWGVIDDVVERQQESERLRGTHPSASVDIIFARGLTDDAKAVFLPILRGFPAWLQVTFNAPGFKGSMRLITRNRHT
jgi:hypothetical protein